MTTIGLHTNSGIRNIFTVSTRASIKKQKQKKNITFRKVYRLYFSLFMLYYKVVYRLYTRSTESTNRCIIDCTFHTIQPGYYNDKLYYVRVYSQTRELEQTQVKLVHQNNKEQDNWKILLVYIHQYWIGVRVVYLRGLPRTEKGWQRIKSNEKKQRIISRHKCSNIFHHHLR